MADKVGVVKGAVQRGGDTMARGSGSVLPDTHFMDCRRWSALIRLAIACYASLSVECVLSPYLVVTVQLAMSPTHIASPLPSGGWEELL